MSDPRNPRVETLVAIDWDSKGLSIQPVLDFVGDALVSHSKGTTPHWKTGAPLVTFEVEFNADQVRNTEVHGRSYHAGFVSHIK